MNKWIEQFEKFYSKFSYEIATESVWSGHEYAIAYLDKLKKQAIDLLTELENLRGNENYFSEFTKATFQIRDVKRFLLPDYDVILDKCFGEKSPFSESEQCIVADAINDKFMKHLNVAVDLLVQAYEKETGKSVDQLEY